jgi:hypothetical protein
MKLLPPTTVGFTRIGFINNELEERVFRGDPDALITTVFVL